MTHPIESRPAMTPEQADAFVSYDTASFVLAYDGPRIRDAVGVLSMLSSDPSDTVLLPAAADFATSPDDLRQRAINTVETLPLIERAIAPFVPKQIDPEQGPNVRWTMDWQAIGKAIKERVNDEPELESQLSNWFLETGSSLVETTFASPEYKKPLQVDIEGANDQFFFRAFLELVSSASPEFRQENGLETLTEHSLAGEDGQDMAWARNTNLVDKVRLHVAERMDTGEIAPKRLVLGSARVLRGNELDIVTNKYLIEGMDRLYPELGVTAADAQLAGSIRAYGGDSSTIVVKDLPSVDEDAVPAKFLTYDSAVGAISMIVTAGSEANIQGQIAKAYQYAPELFEEVDSIYGHTTGIYTWNHGVSLREAAAKIGLDNLPVDALGISAHAAGIPRKLETLVGELTNYLRAMYGLAVRARENSALYIEEDRARGVGKHLLTRSD